jgi:hypothetical protein
MTMPNGHPHKSTCCLILEKICEKAIAEEKLTARMGDRREMNMKNI